MKVNNKKLFFFSFTLTLSFGLVFLFLVLPKAQAVDVNVTADVSATSVCGNGTIEGSEVCDDGNTTDCDGCKGDCSRADDVCGDSIVECGEECESDSDCVNTSCVNCVCGIPCFLAGTQISLPNNQSLAIEKVQVGDIVLSYNENTSQLESAKVLQIFEHQTAEYLSINNKLKVTAEHPLYVNNQWVKAGKVKIGDRLLRQDGQQIIVSLVKVTAGDVLVYNLEVDKNHNYFAEEYLVHNKGECIPNCAGKECGPSNCPGISCGTCLAGYDCIGFQCVSACGNGVPDPGEECDDGNTVSGDGCSATCQLEGGCGDGNLDPGEECDDDNIVSGDCCSSSCEIELHIRNVIASSISNNSATISWTTYSWQNNACEPVSTDSILDWGQDIPPTAGTVSLSADNYSYSLGGLSAGTTYNFLITTVLNTLVDTYSGAFQTTGSAEICDNEVDDDNDGLIDYLDPDCYCEAIYDCTDWSPEECPESGIQTRICEWLNDDVCWNPEPVELTSRTCTPGGCEINCGPCQTINTDLCICEDYAPCCGNNICEPWAVPPETYETCPQDCQVDCVPDWECTEWGECINGIQVRECYDLRACGTNLGRPNETRGCGDCTISCGFCQNLNIEQCVCEDLVPCCGNLICELGETHETCPQDCVEICIPNWVPTEWSECINNRQVRTYEDINNCPYALVPPPDERSCGEDCEVACGLCQELDLITCRCLPRIPCCGNRICEIDFGENSITCPVDCGIPPDLKITLSQCLDGLDNDQDNFIDYPADPGCSGPYDNSELNLAEVVQNILDNPQVEEINKAAAPAAAAAVAVNAFATFSFINFLTYLQFLFSQPIAILFRRKRKKWGVVYNALTKEPVDLAIVRLYKKENNQIVQSRVTDKLGRYNFLASEGNYYLTATKSKFNFPTVYLKDAKEDAKYLDLYHGQTIEIKEENSNIVYNIPIDPIEEVKPAAKIIFQHYLRKIQKVAAFSAVPLALISTIISPSVLTFILLFVHILLFVLFYRLGYQRPPKSWGKVFDKLSNRPISRAITRIYDKQYDKLLETRVTDAKGRYAFLVNNNVYYLTTEKNGYQPFKSDDINLVDKDREAIVSLDIGLGRLELGEKPVSAASVPAKPEAPSSDRVGVPAKVEPEVAAKSSQPSLEEEVESLEVGRGSLEDLLKIKEQAQDIKENIGQKQEELEVLEDKIEDVEQDIDKRLAELDNDQPEGKKSLDPARDKQDKLGEMPEEQEDKSSQPPPEKSIFG